MDFRILGSTEVLDGTRRVELPAGRGRALLALLILHAGEPVAADRIVDELWGEDPPRTADTVVQGLVSAEDVIQEGRGETHPFGTRIQTVVSSRERGIPSRVGFRRIIDRELYAQ